MKINKDFFENDKNLIFVFDLDDTLIDSMSGFVDLLNTHPVLSERVRDTISSYDENHPVSFPLQKHMVDNYYFFGEILNEPDEAKLHDLFTILFGNKDMYSPENVRLFSKSVSFIKFVKDNFGKDSVRVMTASPKDMGVEEIKDDMIKKVFDLPQEHIIHENDKTKGIRTLQETYEYCIFFDDAVKNHSKDLVDCLKTFSVGIRMHHNNLGDDFDENIDALVDDIDEAYFKLVETYFEFLKDKIYTSLKTISTKDEDVIESLKYSVDYYFELRKSLDLNYLSNSPEQFINHHHFKELNGMMYMSKLDISKEYPADKEMNVNILEIEKYLNKIMVLEESLGHKEKEIKKSKSKAKLKKRN